MKKNICGAERVPAGTSMRAGQCGGRSRSHAGASHLSVRCVLVSVAAGVGATLGFPPICQILLTGESRIRI